MTRLNVEYERIETLLGQAIDQEHPDQRIRPRQRLQDQNCSVTALAISGFLQAAGYEAQPIISRPHLSFRPAMAHVMTQVTTEEDLRVIDATYSQFMRYVGISRFQWDKHYFPHEQIAEFPMDDPSVVVDTLLACTRSFRLAVAEQRAMVVKPTENYLVQANEATVEATFREIWNPRHYSPYVPTDDTTIEAGQRFGQILIDELL